MPVISEKAKGCHRSQDSLNYTMRHPPTHTPKKVLAEAKKDSFGRRIKEQLNRKLLLSRSLKNKNICFSKPKSRLYRQYDNTFHDTAALAVLS